MNGIDVARVRADTPSLADRVFLNHAGSSPNPTPVLDAVIGHLRDEARLGGYEADRTRAADRTAVRASIATLVGGEPDGVALTTSATDSTRAMFFQLEFNGAGSIGSSPLNVLRRSVPGYAKINDGSTPFVGDDDL